MQPMQSMLIACISFDRTSAHPRRISATGYPHILFDRIPAHPVRILFDKIALSSVRILPIHAEQRARGRK